MLLLVSLTWSNDFQSWSMMTAFDGHSDYLHMLLAVSVHQIVTDELLLKHIPLVRTASCFDRLWTAAVDSAFHQFLVASAVLQFIVDVEHLLVARGHIAFPLFYLVFSWTADSFQDRLAFGVEFVA